MLRKMGNLMRCQKGQGMTEYIIIVALVAVACILIYNAFGEKIGEKTTDITTTLQDNIKTEGDAAN